MVDKLLHDKGFILFGGMTWTYAQCAEWSAKKLEESGIFDSQMDADERGESHVKSIFNRRRGLGVGAEGP